MQRPGSPAVSGSPRSNKTPQRLEFHRWFSAMLLRTVAPPGPRAMHNNNDGPHHAGGRVFR